MQASAPRSAVAWICFMLTAIAGVALDQWSKVYAFHKLCIQLWFDPPAVVHTQSRIYEFLPGWLHFEVMANQGAVFGVGQGRRTLFIAVSVAAIFFIFYLFSVSGRQRMYQVILGMLLAGVIGNLYDRIRYHYVRDMIHGLPQWRHLFPYIFNVADSLLCVGVFLMVAHSFWQSHRAKRANS